MDKKLLNNPWILALILLAFHLIINFILSTVLGPLQIGYSLPSAISAIVSAILLGQIYASKFRKIMPKILRKNTTIIFIAIQLVLGIPFILMFPELLFLLIPLTVLVLAVYSLLIYYFLGYGGKVYLGSLKKAKKR